MLPNEEILITLSTNECAEGVPPHTVLMIERQLQNGTTLSALGWDKRRFKSFNPWHSGNTDYRAYIDEKSGLLLKSFREEIFQINYIPVKDERQICPVYYRKPKEFVQVFAEHVALVDLRCPQTDTFAGDKIAITAYYAATGQRNRLKWESTGGRILEGQYTKRIILDTTALAGQTITVTVERAVDPYHRVTGSCVIHILPKPEER